MKSKIIKNPKGKFARNFKTDPLGQKYVDIFYVSRGKLGKLLKLKSKKRIIVPKSLEVSSINNNSPKVGFVKINFRKRK